MKTAKLNHKFTLNEVKENICKILKNFNKDSSTNFSEFDEIDFLEFVMEVEEHFEINVNEKTLKNENVNYLLSFLTNVLKSEKRLSNKIY